MNIKILEDKITGFLAGTDGHACSAARIAAGLKIKGKSRSDLHRALAGMVADGRIVKRNGDSYTAGRSFTEVTGRITFARSGNAFIVDTGLDSDVFVSSENTGTGLPGDTVLVQLQQGDRRSRRAGHGRAGASSSGPVRQSGTVVRVVERAGRNMVGTVRHEGGRNRIMPLDAAYPRAFRVEDPAGARQGDMVVVRLKRWTDSRTDPEGEILEVIGPRTDASLDTEAVIRQQGFRTEFSDEVMRCATEAGNLFDKPGDRLDIRDRYVLTIDPETARDFDDALSLEKTDDGKTILGVHIADVSHFVRPGSELDIEARERGTSVYLPDKVIPMLPEQLSNDLCSLRPGEDKLAFSAFITFDEHGNTCATKFAKTIIRSSLRLNYGQAMESVRLARSGARDNAVGQAGARLLRDLDALARLLRKKRFARYALDLSTYECRIIVAPDGSVTDIRPEKNDASHELIEECMVAANEAVAKYLALKGIPSIYRIHEQPDPDRIKSLMIEMESLGFKPPDLGVPKNMARFLKSVSDKPIGHYVRTMVLKSMNRAVYSATNKGHFGLAKRYYTHFTSPIRRYPDLLAHRILARTLGCGGAGYSERELANAAAACSARERAAEEAERIVDEIKIYRFLEQELKGRKRRSYEAVVVGVVRFGMFVEIMDLGAQGLVHASELSDRNVRYSHTKRSLRAGRSVFTVGDRMHVRVKKVDIEKRQLDFELAI